jgi:phosphate/sulfate permease
MKKFKVPAILFGMAVLSTVAHNLISATLGIEEPVFFSLSFMFLVGAMATFVFSILKGRG